MDFQIPSTMQKDKWNFAQLLKFHSDYLCIGFTLHTYPVCIGNILYLHIYMYFGFQIVTDLKLVVSSAKCNILDRVTKLNWVIFRHKSNKENGSWAPIT